MMFSLCRYVMPKLPGTHDIKGGIPTNTAYDSVKKTEIEGVAEYADPPPTPREGMINKPISLTPSLPPSLPPSLSSLFLPLCVCYVAQPSVKASDEKDGGEATGASEKEEGEDIYEPIPGDQ